MAEALRVGIAGLGTVGASVARVLRDKAGELTRQCGRDIVVAAVSARDPKSDRGVDISSAKWFDDPVKMAQSAEIDVFIELIGGDEGPARLSVTTAPSRSSGRLACYAICQSPLCYIRGVAAHRRCSPCFSSRPCRSLDGRQLPPKLSRSRRDDGCAPRGVRHASASRCQLY